MGNLKRKRVFDWSSAMFGQYLLKISYRGTDYSGLAWQPFDALYEDGHHANMKTIEGVLFKALQKTCLTPNRRLSNFSRCGRTDKGVHSAGNYISVRLRRPALVDVHQETSCISSDCDYRGILNAVLPEDVRVLECHAVEPNFDARCIYRIYKYFFINEHYDIKRMEMAGRLFEGTHNFRHFCKVDGARIVNYTRTLLWVKFKPVWGSLVWEIEIAGLSFLWQQIRRMVGLLLLIGAHRAEPALITTLLEHNIHETPPLAYNIAPADGLVLYECFFEGIHSGLPRKENCALDTFEEQFLWQIRRAAVYGCLSGRPAVFFPTEDEDYQHLPGNEEQQG